MAWVRLHDGAMLNIKIAKLSNSAFRLWIRGLCYCQTALTDGVIPREALRDMGAGRKDITILSTSQLEGKGPLWDRHVLGFKVHDYLDWNDCRDTVLDRQKKAKKRKEDWEIRMRSGRDKNVVRNAS